MAGLGKVLHKTGVKKSSENWLVCSCYLGLPKICQKSGNSEKPLVKLLGPVYKSPSFAFACSWWSGAPTASFQVKTEMKTKIYLFPAPCECSPSSVGIPCGACISFKTGPNNMRLVSIEREKSDLQDYVIIIWIELLLACVYSKWSIFRCEPQYHIVMWSINWSTGQCWLKRAICSSSLQVLVVHVGICKDGDPTPSSTSI